MTRLLGLLLACLLACCRVWAQSHFDSWTIDNGLPQNSVRAILQTRDGYLWFTTLNGLVRYDGARFTVFDKGNSPGIKSNRLTYLFEDAEGSLWIETEQDGLLRYANATFTAYPGSVIALYKQVAPTPDNGPIGFWLLNDEVLARWQNKALTPAAAPSRFTGDHASARVALPLDLQARAHNSGAAYATAAGLHVYRDGQWLTYTTKDGLSSVKINSLYRDGRGSLWIGTEDAGLNRLRDGQFTVYRKQDGLPSDRIEIKAACEDRRGNLWFALVGGGLYRLKNGALTVYTAADGLSGNGVQTIYEDREGSLWIGTRDGGISRWREEVVRVYAKRNGLFGDNVYPIYEDRAGNVWIGTWPGLNRYRNGVFTHHPDANGAPLATVTALSEDRESALWVGSYGSGVRRWKNGWLPPIPGLTGSDANAFLAIQQDRAGALWFGTTAGLFKYAAGVVTRLTVQDGLPHKEVIALHEDQQGGLWIGTRGGLAHLRHLQDQTFTVYTEKDALSSNHVRSLYEDERGVLWIGTYDGGLNRLQNGRFTSYTMREGMFDNGVFQILDDQQGNFWMSSNRGIYRVKRQELEDFAAGKIRAITTVGYGKGDGMLNAECNGGVQSAGTRTRDGKLWFPTQQGVAVIDPAAIQANSLPPPVLIEEITLDDQKVPFDSGMKILPGQERFEIRYTGLSFIKPEQVRFKYRLEGLDSDWVDAGTRRSVNYSYVPPGKYTFRVIAANSDGVWNMEGVSIPIVVQPPFYRTWWFMTLCALAIAAALSVGHRFRIRKLEREKVAQQEFSRQLIASQEIERKRIAGELHDGLGQSLLVIKNRALFGMRRPEDSANAIAQFSEISTVVSESIQEVRQISTNLHPYQLDQIGLTKSIKAMILRISDSTGLDIVTEIDNIDGLFDTTGEINIYRVVQECLNNIVKHAAASEADVTINRDAQNVMIVVSDNGKGFSPSEIKSGFGLTGMSERAQMLNGIHTVESSPDHGTTITLRIGLTEK